MNSISVTVNLTIPQGGNITNRSISRIKRNRALILMDKGSPEKKRKLSLMSSDAPKFLDATASHEVTTGTMTTPQPYSNQGIPMASGGGAIVASSGSVATGSNSNVMQDAAPAVGGHQDVLDLLRTICDEINTFRIEVNARFDGVDARLDGFDIRLGRLSASHYEVTALQRVLDAINLWWDIQLDAIANHKVFATTPGYDKTFTAASVYFNSLEQNVFRVLHSLLAGTPFQMFESLEYNGLASTTFKSQVPMALPPKRFYSPSRLASTSSHNTLIIVETTLQNLCPDKTVTDSWISVWQHTPAQLEKFETTHATDPSQKASLNYLRNLLKKLLQLEKQLTLQLEHFASRPKFTPESLRAAVRVVLVSPHPPSDEILGSVLKSVPGKAAFPHLNALFLASNFRVWEYALPEATVTL